MSTSIYCILEFLEQSPVGRAGKLTYEANMATDNTNAESLFDDPSYDSVPLSDGSYDSPSVFLDQVPQQTGEEEKHATPQKPVDEALQPQPQPPAVQNGDPVPTGDPSNLVEESGAYSTVDDFLREDTQADNGLLCDTDSQEGGEVGEEDDEEGEEGEENGGKAMKRKVKVRQSHTSHHGKEEESDKIYVTGDLVPPQPMFSFKSRVRARSKEELEQEGIYQGLVITDEQKQLLGIMPESIYMTVALETSRDELDHMSMEMSPNSSKPAGQQSVTPAYRGLVLHPPPLPPLNQGAPTTQRKCHAVIENVLKSEAAFLTSLKVAEHVYMNPLLQMTNPPLDRDQVKVLFGPLAEVMAHHELFYTALTQRTMDWGPKQTVGSVFMTFHRKEVIGHYVEYVNNFTDAMALLQKSIKKRPKFVSFLKEKYNESKTSLSLQGLLLKPVQRFPQYILFLQDLIKYTPPHHPDRVTLQLALARCETIAEHLNEAKRTKEQQTIVAHLSSRVTLLPFKLTDSPNRSLLTQEAVTRLMLSPQGSDNLVEHKRSLLLFNNMVMCTALSSKKSAAKAPHDFGLYDDAHYKCKWFSPLDKLSVVEPDYSNDIWDYVVRQDDSEEVGAYEDLKSQYMKHTQDFLTMSKIACLVSSLADTYTGLTMVSVQNHLRVLQRMIARTKEQLRRGQPGRLDIQIPSRDGSRLIHHTYVFDSEKAKQNWLNNLRYATLKLKDENKMSWVYAENAEDDDIVLDSGGQLPLFVEHYHLTNNSESLSTECATKTLDHQVWFASCSSTIAEIAIVQCVTPKPILLKSFTVDSSRILAICYAPGEASSHHSTPRQSSALISSPSISTHPDTVWMGSQAGKLMIHPASSEMAHRCMEVINFSGTITCIEYYKSQVFIAVEGNIYIYRRPKGSEWDLDNPLVVKVHNGDDPIICMCQVQQKLWIGAGNLCYVLNMLSCQTEGHFQVSRQPTAIVRKMASSGSGVWMSFRRSATVQLFHTVTKTLLQEIDIEKAFLRIALKHDLQSRMHSTANLRITSLLLCQGYLWIGLSTGAVMVYRTPYLKTVPIVTGKPYMATFGHSSGVRVLISTHTVGTLSSSRLTQFISEEQERFQEDWESVEFYDENHVTPWPSSTNIDSARAEGETSGLNTYTLIPEEVEEKYSTFPALPPPIFSTDTLTLETTEPLAVEVQEKSTTAANKDILDSTPTANNTNVFSTLPSIESQTLTNGHNDTSTKGMPSSETPTASNAAQYTSDGVCLPMPMRRRSSKSKTSPKRESGEMQGSGGTFHRIPTPEFFDGGTFPPIPTPEAEESAGEQGHHKEEQGALQHNQTPEAPTALYDRVATDESPYPDRKKSPSPYEDPATLDLAGPIPVQPMPDFFTTLDQPMVSLYGSKPVTGAIYVLTGGRGLVNLRPDKRGSVRYISQSESCIVAYELKH